MTAYELAERLLEGPDYPVLVGPHMSDIDYIDYSVYNVDKEFNKQYCVEIGIVEEDY